LANDAFCLFLPLNIKHNKLGTNSRQNWRRTQLARCSWRATVARQSERLLAATCELTSNYSL